jgi:hypothetical protein
MSGLTLSANYRQMTPLRRRDNRQSLVSRAILPPGHILVGRVLRPSPRPLGERILDGRGSNAGASR